MEYINQSRCALSQLEGREIEFECCKVLWQLSALPDESLHQSATGYVPEEGLEVSRLYGGAVLLGVQQPLAGDFLELLLLREEVNDFHVFDGLLFLLGLCLLTLVW